MRTFVFALALSFLGCASGSTPARKSFNSISDTVAAGTAAMKAFNERYQSGLQTEADRTKVLAGWAEFQSAIHFAETLAKDPNRTTDPVAAASDAVYQLLNLIAALRATPSGAIFGVPLITGAGTLSVGGLQ